MKKKYLDDTTKEKVKAIFNQSKAGTLTKEQVKTQIDEVFGIQKEKNKQSE